MWFEGSHIDQLRSTKEKHEGIDRYNWEEYNMENYGCFRIKDDANHVKLSFSLVRQDDDLVMRVSGEAIDKTDPPANLTLLHFVQNPYVDDAVSIGDAVSRESGLVGVMEVYHF